MIEDCRHVSGPLERFLLDHGEPVVRLAPRLMAGARETVRERGKSDPIDALAVARAALREGIETLPTARLVGPELEIRQLAVHRERLINARTRLINELRWELHDLWPEWEIPKRVLIGARWQQQVDRRLKRAPISARVRIARRPPAKAADKCGSPSPDRPRKPRPEVPSALRPMFRHTCWRSRRGWMR